MDKKMISIYDPAANAFREVPISVARKFVDASKKVEKQLAKLEKQK